MYCLCGSENGFVLTVALIFMIILALLGATATILTTTDIKIGANYRASEKSLYVAEAGAQEARERLRKSGETYEITDAHLTAAQWTAYIGSDVKTKKKGWDSTNSMHVKAPSLQTDMDYTVKIVHQLDPSGNVLYLGDVDGDGDFERHADSSKGHPNIYLISSYGNAEGGNRVVLVEATKVPPITVKAALYAGTYARIQGSSTDIIGEDSCGDPPEHLPGIGMPDASDPVVELGGPIITGDPIRIDYAVSPAIDVQEMVDSLKGAADFSYAVSGATHTDTTIPGPGDGWGTPTPGASQEDPSTCAERNIVHYDTDGTDIQLKGGVSGCGILLVEGDLDANGGFSWYGPVIVTGSLTFTGGGDTNITGAVLTGEDTDGDIIGGNTNIIYCSNAVKDFEKHPLQILSWKDYE